MFVAEQHSVLFVTDTVWGLHCFSRRTKYCIRFQICDFGGEDSIFNIIT